MFIGTDDGTFGVRLVHVGPLPGHTQHLTIMQMKVGDVWLGDGEPAIEWSSVAALGEVPEVGDVRVDPRRHAPAEILALLISDSEPALHDATLPAFGEGFDAYACRAYVYRGEAVFLFENVRSHQPDPSGASVIMARLPAADLAVIAAAAEAAYRTMVPG